MDTFRLRRFGYSVSIATMISLTWLAINPAGRLNPSTVALAASDPVIAAAGDIACDPTNSSFNNGNGTSGSCRPKYTSDLLVDAGLAAVLPLGDNQYYCGGYQAYQQSYDLSWGRVKSITRPVVGNHEYLTSGGTDCTSANTGATGYFNYFGTAAGNPGQGYYSYDIGAWHLIALNSNCSSAGGCGSTSPQGQWLAADLAAHPSMCTLAYWHIPLFSSGGRASSNTLSIWQTLYNNDVDVVLNGHDHIYERFAPQTPNGTVDTVRGIREFIIGSGGANHTSLATIAANSELRNTDTYGILKLTLHPTSYDWQFVPEAGKTFTDSGTGICHGSGPSGTPLPTVSASPTPTVGNSPTATPPGTLYTFAPSDDAYIYQTTATTNYGSATTLQTDNSPVKDFLLKFNLSGLSGQQIRSARLRLYNMDASNAGGDIYAVSDNTWQEGTVTWNNAPPASGALLASFGSVQVNTWYEADLSSLITAAGTYSLRVVSTSTNGADYSSKEGANPPQLVIETQSLPTPSATATSTATLTATASATLTATTTPTSTATLTATPSATPTGTLTATPASTTTPTATAVPSQTPTPTPTVTTTATFTETATGTPTSTALATPSATPTGTSTATQTGIATTTATETPSDPPIASATPTDTATAAPPPSETQNPTFTPLPSATLTGTATPTSTGTATATSLPTGTATPSFTPPPAPTPTGTGTPTSTPIPQTLVFVPSADSYVDASSPTTNYGTRTTIRVDGSPTVRTYLRFSVQGLSGTVTRVTLRVYANSSSSGGYLVNSVSDNTWTETSLTYNTAPPIGAAAGSSGSFSGGVWTTVDITSLVTGNGAINLALGTSSSTAISLASRESGANAPQLLVETLP